MNQLDFNLDLNGWHKHKMVGNNAKTTPKIT